MKLVALSQRVDTVTAYHEQRDALDQRWTQLLLQCDAIPLLLPNDPVAATRLLQQLKPAAVILTGGNSLMAYQGDSPARDATETQVLQHCIATCTPVLGICRGMQLIQHYFGQVLQEVSGHVATRCELLIAGELHQVNSYHQLGCYDNTTELQVVAQAADGVIKAVRHPTLSLQGIMWHPERETPFSQADLQLIQGLIR